MRYYVHFIDGRTLGAPIALSSDPTASPNVHWGLEQMKLNGYMPALVNFDPALEKLDYQNPLITSSSIIYNTIPLSQEEKDKYSNIQSDAKRNIEYPSIHDLTVALWELIIEKRPEASQQLQNKRLEVKAKYPKVS